MIHHKKGFTMIELLVVATILAVLAAAAMVSYSSVNIKSRDSKRLSDLEQVRSALEMYRADNGNYLIGSWSDLSALKTDGYIDKLPVDPKNVNPYTYTSDATGATYSMCADIEGPPPANPSCTCSSPYDYCVKNP